MKKEEIKKLYKKKSINLKKIIIYILKKMLQKLVTQILIN